MLPEAARESKVGYPEAPGGYGEKTITLCGQRNPSRLCNNSS